jgi:hypothetical protein
MLVGGDFILHRQEDKNNDNSNTRWPCVFNAIIESLGLREIALSGCQFTWANRCSIPTYEKLDRILTSVEWEQKFLLVSVRALTRAGSDHTHLFFLIRENKLTLGTSLNSLLNSPGCGKMILKIWFLKSGIPFLMGGAPWRRGKKILDTSEAS